MYTPNFEKKKNSFDPTLVSSLSVFFCIHFFHNRTAPVQCVSSTVGSPVVGQNSKMAESEVEPP